MCESDFVISDPLLWPCSDLCAGALLVFCFTHSPLNVLLMSNTKLSPPMKKAKSIDSKNAAASASDDPNAPALIAANLSRKKATPPHPPKKFLIRFHKGTPTPFNSYSPFRPEHSLTIHEWINCSFPFSILALFRL